MELVPLARYAALHDTTRQAATRWRTNGVLVCVGGKIDVAASDVRMKNAGLGRFKHKASAAAKLSNSDVFSDADAAMTDALEDVFADAVGSPPIAEYEHII